MTAPQTVWDPACAHPPLPLPAALRRDSRGEVSGQLVIEHFGGWLPGYGQVQRYAGWCCRCACGRRSVLRLGHFRHIHSCGCQAHPARPRDLDRARVGNAWRALRRNHPDADPAWLADRAVFAAAMGPCPEGMELGRQDDRFPHGPENSRWVPRRFHPHPTHSTPKTWQGQTHSLVEWARALPHLGLTRERVSRRLREGWTLDETLTTPVSTEHQAYARLRRRQARPRRDA